MNTSTVAEAMTQAKFEALHRTHREYIEGLQKEWLQENNHRPKAWRLYELDAEERQRVDGVIRNWEEYVTPLAEAWWRERGFGVRWPKKSSESCEYYKLKTASA